MPCYRDKQCATTIISISLHGGFVLTVGLYLLLNKLLRSPLLSKKTLQHASYQRFPLHIVKCLVTIILVITQLFSIAEGVLTAITWHSIQKWELYVLDIVSLIGTVVATLLSYHAESCNKAVVLVVVLVMYWISSIAVELQRTFQIMHISHTYYRLIGFYISILSGALYLVLTVLDIHVIRKKKCHSGTTNRGRDMCENENLRYRPTCRSFLSQFTLNWMNSFLAYGFRNTLQLEDLGTMPQSENVKRNYEALRTEFKKEKERCGGNRAQASLWLCVWRAYWPMIVLTGVYKLISDQLMFVAPICLDFMVAYVIRSTNAAASESILNRTSTSTLNHSAQSTTALLEVADYFSNGYILTLVTLTATLLYATLWQNNCFLASRQGVRCKGALQALVFNKTLRLSTQGITEEGTTQGQIINHIAVDPLNVFLFFYLAHYTWTLPLQVMTGFVLLYLKLGVAALLSGLILVFMVPVQYYLGVLLARVQKQIMIKADDRLKKTNEILQSIKLLKLYAWEKMFSDRVTETRKEELKLLLKAGLIRTLSILVTDGAPVAAALATFCLYPYFETKPMEAGKVFSGLAIFAILSIPLFLITVVMNGLSHAIVSMRRLKDFLFTQEIENTELSQTCRDDSKCNGKDGKVSVSYFPDSTRNGGIQETSVNTPMLDKPSHEAIHAVEENVHCDKCDSIDAVLTPERVVCAHDCCFSWDSSTKETVIRNLNISIRKGELTMIVGPVGSGKSSLISALLGEMTTISGHVVWNKNARVAYVQQNAWIMNASVRDNILFGTPMDCERYERVLDACALRPDLDILIAGDQTEIGERGVNLSGGQKQRVSLARAVYSNLEVIVMDDPLSALDAHVGHHVFEHVITNMLLKEQKTVILVTHQIHFLPKADQILVISDGDITNQGTYEAVMTRVPNLEKTLEKESVHNERPAGASYKAELTTSNPSIHIELSQSPEAKSCQFLNDGALDVFPAVGLRAACSVTSLTCTGIHEERFKRHREDLPKSNPSLQINQLPLLACDTEKNELELGRLIGKEERASGSVPLKTYLYYFKSGTVFLSSATILFYIVRQILRLITDFWLASWAEASQQAADIDEANAMLLSQNNSFNQSLLQTNEYILSYYMTRYAIYIVISIITCGLGMLSLELMGVFAAKNFHRKMLAKVVYAPMRFFDTTPLGRIINRFAGDTNMIDEKMPIAWDQVLFCFVYVLGGIIVNAMTTPSFILAALIIFILYLAVQRFYIASSRELNRLDAVTKSPILSHFSETLSGLTTIRAYRVEKQFTERNLNYIEYNNAACLFRESAHVWMGIRLDMLGALIVFAASVSSITSGLYGLISPGIVGLSIAYAIMISSFLNYLMRGVSELEMWFNAVDRVASYTDIDIEPQTTGNVLEVPPEWPASGAISFDGTSLRYDASLPPVVRQLSLNISPGEKVGICGRTGSGKSSLTLSLFRMLDVYEGRIVIDGLDIANVPLQRLRSSLSIIPQDPVLFGGSIRFNLDPSRSKSDAQIWNALEISQLKSTIQELPLKLDSVVSEGGENFSVGQRQLFCLARALLHNSPILIMDEATASIDIDTDKIIQDVIQRAFCDKTVLTIAHRIRTILTCDTIAVLEDGRIIEYGSPETLMKDESSSFAQMQKRHS